MSLACLAFVKTAFKSTVAIVRAILIPDGLRNNLTHSPAIMPYGSDGSVSTSLIFFKLIIQYKILIFVSMLL